MEEEKYSFIVALLSDPKLTTKDRERVSKLLSKEMDQNLDKRIRSIIESLKVEPVKETPQTTPMIIVHKPKDTADFLSLFSQREGFKYLTHNFDNASMALDEMLANVRKTFKINGQKYKIPRTLWALMNTFINGGKDKERKPLAWKDFAEDEHTENYGTDEWLKWSRDNNNQHPLNNEDFAPIIQKFRSTTRVVGMSSLDKLIKLIQKGSKKIGRLNIETENVDKADFYTNVQKLVWGIRFILRDMSQDHSDFNNIKVTYKPELEGDYFLNRIIILQKGSVSQKNINDVINKYYGNQHEITGDGGAFSDIASNLVGYCNWSVESLFDGKPYRWNILRDNPEIQETEEIDSKDVEGFKHILTFYSKG